MQTRPHGSSLALCMSHTGTHSSRSHFEPFKHNKTNTISQLKLLSGLRTTVLFIYRPLPVQNRSKLQLEMQRSPFKNCLIPGSRTAEPDSRVAGIKGLAYFQSCHLIYFSKLPCSLLPFCTRYWHCLVIIGHLSLPEFVSRDLTLPVSGHNATAFISPLSLSPGWLAGPPAITRL